MQGKEGLHSGDLENDNQRLQTESLLTSICQTLNASKKAIKDFQKHEWLRGYKEKI